jgi:hypothetical protein
VRWRSCGTLCKRSKNPPQHKYNSLYRALHRAFRFLIASNRLVAVWKMSVYASSCHLDSKLVPNNHAGLPAGQLFLDRPL